LHETQAMRRQTWLPATEASAGAARAMVRDAATEAGLGGMATWDLMLATTEAVISAVRRGKAWPNDCILFATQRSPRGLRVEVWTSDGCGWFSGWRRADPPVLRRLRALIRNLLSPPAGPGPRA
jgi:anti-sigma regulatory factor (Ser/Thr protein kinase)